MVVRIRNRTLQCLLDTGAVSSVISLSLVRQLRLKIQPPASQDYLIAASGEHLKIIGNVDINLQIRGLTIPHIFTVIEGLYPNLLVGTDFLTANQAVINCHNHTVTFNDGLIVMPLQNFQNCYNCAT